MAVTTKIVKKLSMKVLAGGRPIIPQDGSTNWLANIIGIGSAIKHGESNYGAWRAVLGQFIAETVSKETGELLRFRTGTLFLPDVALNLIAPVIESSGKGAQTQFAFRVGVIKDDTSATGYIYVAESLVELEENDPLEMLLNKALPSLPALPKPAKKKEQEADKVST